MRIPKINLSYSGYPDADLLKKSNHIFSSVGGNPTVFVSPLPWLPNLGDATATYATNLTAAADLGRVNISNKNQSRKVLIDALVQLSRYVTLHPGIEWLHPCKRTSAPPPGQSRNRNTQ